jgi:DinB superfamily
VDNLSARRAAIHHELDRAAATFHALLDGASSADLRRGTAGTRWTNQQMLFHLLFGYLIVRTLLGLVRVFGRLPDRASLLFARVLNSATRPFHLVNYLGSCGGGLVVHGPALGRLFDRTVDALHRHLDAESEESLARGMHFPRGWDPFFADRMTLADVYHYGTVHFDFHRRQLTL